MSLTPSTLRARLTGTQEGEPDDRVLELQLPCPAHGGRLCPWEQRFPHYVAVNEWITFPLVPVC